MWTPNVNEDKWWQPLFQHHLVQMSCSRQELGPPVIVCSIIHHWKIMLWYDVLFFRNSCFIEYLHFCCITALLFVFDACVQQVLIIGYYFRQICALYLGAPPLDFINFEPNFEACILHLKCGVFGN